MIQSLKQIKNRIHSISNTEKVTYAMQMISVSKLNKLLKTLYGLRLYYLKLEVMLVNLIGSQKAVNHSFFEEREKISKVLLCVVTSDNGLCGLYNYNVLRMAEEFIEEKGRDKVDLIVIGKIGFDYFQKKGIKIMHRYLGLNGKYDELICDGITNILVNLFTSKKADEVYAAYMHFENASIQKVRIKKLLNIKAVEGKETQYIFEPDINHVLSELMSRYVKTKMRLNLMEAFISEHAARSIAMKTATENADELLDGLVLLRNKVRQATITQDIMEIISSVEALKG